MSFLKKKQLKKRDRLIAFWLAMISSVLLLISGTTGVASWTTIRTLISTYLDFQVLNILFILIIIIASFGGIAVFIGGWLILKNRLVSGNLFVLFGSGAGVISLIINIFVAIFAFEFSIHAYTSISSLGILFAIAAQMIIAKDKTKKLYRKVKKTLK